ncbi:MAG: sulfotransferase family protein [Bacillota bacterium]
MNKSKLFLVLCLHRSGSSATAGVMHHLGIHMGDHLFKPDQANPKGYFENSKFVELNDSIIKECGGDTYNPPIREKVLKCGFPAKDIRQFLTAHAKPVWGLKDPRTVITFEVWKPNFLNITNITYVFVHRPFHSSVRSMAHRDGISLQEAKKVLITYLGNLDFYRHALAQEKADIIDVHFEQLLKKPDSFVRDINQRIGRKPEENLEKVKGFLDAHLKHF